MGVFTDMLDRTGEDIKAPPLPPVGTYVFQVKSQAAIEEISGTDKNPHGWDSVVFQLELLSADSVDPVDLEEFGKIEGYPVRHNIMITNDPEDERGQESALNRVKTFLQQIGIDFDGKTSLREALAQAPGCQGLVQLGRRPNKNDPEQFYLNIDKVFPLG